MFKSIANLFKNPTTNITPDNSQNLSTPKNNIADKKRSTMLSALTNRKNSPATSQAIDNTKPNNPSQVTLKSQRKPYKDPFSTMIDFSDKAYKNKARQTNIVQQLYSLALGDLLNNKNEINPWSNDNYSTIMGNLSKKDQDFYFKKLKSLAPIIISHAASKDPNYQQHIDKLRSKGIEIFINPPFVSPPDGFYDGLTENKNHGAGKEKVEIKTSKEPAKEFHDEIITGTGHEDIDNNSNYSNEMLANLKDEYNQK